jgi:hypothetical protein
MAYLQPPLTIISSNEFKNKLPSHQFHLPAATWFDEDQNHFVALEERIRSDPGYDGTLCGSVSGGGASLVSGLESLVTRDDSEILSDVETVRYQAFGLSRRNNHQSSSNNHHGDDDQDGDSFDGSGRSSDSSEGDIRVNNLSAFESAAKKYAAANDKAANRRRSLSTEIAVSFHLPASLANIENRGRGATSDANDTDTDVAGTDDDEDSTTVTLTRRIPILAKFSPMVNDTRYLALQYTPT